MNLPRVFSSDNNGLCYLANPVMPPSPVTPTHLPRVACIAASPPRPHTHLIAHPGHCRWLTMFGWPLALNNQGVSTHL
jgi:hypothetical protein